MNKGPRRRRWIAASALLVACLLCWWERWRPIMRRASARRVPTRRRRPAPHWTSRSPARRRRPGRDRRAGLQRDRRQRLHDWCSTEWTGSADRRPRPRALARRPGMTLGASPPRRCQPQLRRPRRRASSRRRRAAAVGPGRHDPCTGRDTDAAGAVRQGRRDRQRRHASVHRRASTVRADARDPIPGPRRGPVVRAQEEAAGAHFTDNGVPGRRSGSSTTMALNYVRLRLWVEPAAGYSDLASDLRMARRIKAAGRQALPRHPLLGLLGRPATPGHPGRLAGSGPESADGDRGQLHAARDRRPSPPRAPGRHGVDRQRDPQRDPVAGGPGRLDRRHRLGQPDDAAQGGRGRRARRQPGRSQAAA